MDFFVRGHWTEWEAWESPQKMFPLEVETELFWSFSGVHWSMEAIGDQGDKALEGPEWAGEGTSDQVGSCYQWSPWCILTAIIKGSEEKDSVMWLGSPMHLGLKLTAVTTTLWALTSPSPGEVHLGSATFSSQGHHSWYPRVPHGIRGTPHKTSSLKAQTCPVSLLRETLFLKSCPNSQVCHTSLTRRLYQ